MKVGKFIGDYPIEKLTMVDENRDVETPNLEDKKNKLEEWNWMSPIIISKSGKILEGQHRYRAANELNQKTIPVYIVDWIQEDDVDEIRDAIISLNNGNRPWTQWDYIKTYSKNIPAYTALYKNCIEFNGILSTGNVVNAMVGISSANKRFKEGNSELKPEDVYIYLLDAMKGLVQMYGKTKFPSQALRTFAIFVHNECDKDFKLISYLVQQMRLLTTDNSRVPDGDFALSEWLKMQKDVYLSVSSSDNL